MTRKPQPKPLPGGVAGVALAWLAALTLGLGLGDLRAGDILRGGAPVGDAARRSAAANQATAEAAAAARASARDSLARTTRALNAAKAMQAAARAAAAGNNAGMNPNAPGTLLPNVPNGLAPGGLQVDPGVAAGTAVWSGASLPAQSQSGGRTLVNIKQTQQTAVLNWRTFNVGRQTRLQFDQRAGGRAANKWIAFNKVNDPSNAPSQILGSIQAPGQVYVINRNGIIFGAGSQVNVATLVASSLPINDNLIERGLLNNPDAQFLFSGIAIPAGAKGTPAFTPELPNPLIGRYGDVTVQAGATIVSPTNEAGVGGRVMLVGPNVRNSGTIRTPDGQTILAAGLQVGIDAHATSDPSLRGLDVYVGAVREPGGPIYAGSVTHNGYLDVSRGNATFMGRTVRQHGAIESETTVSVNGRIDLLAYYDASSNPNYNAANPSAGPPFLVRNSGAVTFGAGSVTSVQPALRSAATTIGKSLPLDSQINVSGRTIHLGRDARLHAPGGRISLAAGEWRLLGGAAAATRFVSSAGQVYLDAGATIDVAGTAGVSAPLTQNLLTLELRGAELANSPLQRAGMLRGIPITVDIRNKGVYNGLNWVGTPLGDVSGFAALIPRTAGELTVRGGSVTISAGDSVVMQRGSRIDVSGGHIDFQGATVKTTRLWSNGRLFDIKDATPDRIYDGIYSGTMTVTSARWGVTRTFAQPLALTGEHYEPGYVHGADGGSIDIRTPAMALDGEFLGRTVNGPRQRSERAGLSSLRLAFLGQDATYPTFPDFSPNPPRVVFGEGSQAPAGPFRLLADGNAAGLGADRKGTVFLSPSLLSARGFGKLTVENPDGEIVAPAGVNLEAPPLGEIALRGSIIEIGGRISAPGGRLSFNAPNLPLSLINLLSNTANPQIPDSLPGRGRFFLAPGASLSTAGLIVDDRVVSPVWSPLVTAGGTIDIAGFDTTIAVGSLIDVSGGVQMPFRSRAIYGNAGALEIAGGRDLTYPGVLGGNLTLGGTLLGYSGIQGGALRLTGPAFHIGGGAADPRAMRLDPEFFSQGGFASFALSGIGLPGATLEDSVAGVTIAPGTRIRPVVEGLLAIPHPAGSSRLDLVRFTRPEGMRTPASLEFNALGAVDPFTTLPIVLGKLVMGAGASIETDALGSATFTGDTVTLLGRVTTPGGSIAIRGANRYPSVTDLTEALPTVFIGPRARLDASGTAVVRTNARGWREGSILPGGSIRVSGNIVAERGAVFDVSGTTGVLDLPNTYLNVNNTLNTGLRGVRPVPVRFDTSGGSIALTGSQMLYTDATLIGRPGGPAAIGGSLSVSSDKFRPAGVAFNTAEANLIVKQSGLTLPNSPLPRGVGIPLRGPGGAVLPGIGNLAVSSFAGGGFDSLTLGGNVQFEGPVRIDMPGSIRAATGGVIYANSTVDLSATYVALGQPFRLPSLATEQTIRFTQTTAAGVTTPYTFAPEWGRGRLTVRAELIDVGDLSLQGIGNARLLAPKGDVRGNGTMQIAGNLLIQAGQVYPTTMGTFNIFAYDYDPGTGVERGSVTIAGGNARPLPMSGGGTLSIQASNILQGGTLRAPLGVINLGWDGAGAAPANPLAGASIAAPMTQRLTLAAGSVTSVSAIDPFTGQGILIPYGISFDGSSWIDPAGNDITVGGLPTKAIRLSGAHVTTETGSTIDIRGGGDLYAYRWAQGIGGEIDILASDGRFAVIPGYEFFYAPYAPFNTGAAATNLAGEPGYVNARLKAGDRITLGSSPGLPGGAYTLLPARYALLPGAFLVTPSSATPFPGPPIGTFTLPDGSSLVSGYRSNDLDAGRAGRTAIQRFEVAPGQVVRQRAEYFDYYANSFLREAAEKRDFRPPRLPIDSGYLAFSAIQSMTIAGDVLSTPPKGGRGSLIDISSPIDIVINDTGAGGGPGILTLSASKLSTFNAESLLIGGLRTFGTGAQAGVATVNVTTGNISVENAASVLKGSDIILAAKGRLSVAPGSILTGTGSAELDRIVVGNASVEGSGDGVLIRVAGSEYAPVTRLGVGNSTAPRLTVGADAVISGGSVTLDSTYATSLDPTAVVAAPVTALNSGQISVQLFNPGPLNPTVGLVLSGQALEILQQSARDLSLLSYSTFDVYGSGSVGSRALGQLAIQASAIRGFNTAGGEAVFSARNLILENATGRSVAALPVNPLSGRLTFDADRIVLGANDLRIERFATVSLRADSRILNTGVGSLAVANALEMATPLVTGTGASRHTISAGGALRIYRPAVGGVAGAAGGLGADLTLQGASVDLNTDVLLPTGRLNVVATSGNLSVGTLDSARLSVSGTTRVFLDTIRHTGGGTIGLTSQTGSVTVGGQAVVDVSAPSGGGDAGFLDIAAPAGTASLLGVLRGGAAAGERTGSFSLDANTVPGGSLAATDAILNAGQFLEMRDYRVRSGNLTIGGVSTARIYRAAADNGSITVSGVIDASGIAGGEIHLAAKGSLTLLDGARLDASADRFNAAGKGGSIVLEAGASRNGIVDPAAMLDLRTGSTIDLSVAENTPGSQALGRFTGALHLRAPQTPAFDGVQIHPIGSTVSGASHILAEAYRLYDVTGSGLLNNALRDSILANSNAFLGSAGSASATHTAILNQLTSLQPGLDLILAPGAEIVNRTGSLTLGTPSSGAANDWNLAGFRFGPRAAPGVLTLRAAENIVLYNAISDGFSGGTSLWLAPLAANNPLLPDNIESWSYRFTAGADTAAAGFRETRLPASLADGAGFFQLGKNMGASTATGGNNALTSSIVGNNFNVIRTGSGNIDITAARSIQLLNPFASIYTAGTQVASPNSVLAPNDFVTPILSANLAQGSLGAVQQIYPAQYSLAGGNVVLAAGENIERKTRNNSGLIDDSSRQFPNNWLNRRGYVGPDGNYGNVNIGFGFNILNDPAASTTWWVNFSNFFQDVGALGGGNVSLIAGQNVKNVSAALPTNARAPMGAPNPANLLEFGGGDLLVRSGNNIDGGVYYVEKGRGVLEAGGNITTNATRSPSLGLIQNLNNPDSARFDPLTWMPTTLFAGRSSFEVTARGDVLMGPVANPFLLPTGLNNRFWYKTYFSTYGEDASVDILSLGGNVTLRNAVTLPDRSAPVDILRIWLETQNLLVTGSTAAAFSQPWLRLGETSVNPFSSLLSLRPPTLTVAALSGDIDLSGNISLYPSPTGQLELLAAGALNALRPTGISSIRVPGQNVQVWSASSINVSDSDPAAVPGAVNPFNYFGLVGSGAGANNTTRAGFLDSLAVRFTESGASTGARAVSQTKQALHASGLLHRNDPEPVRLYALGGDISGLTLFTPKPSRIHASKDIADIAFYLQNLDPGDATVVTAGRDIVPYNASTAARSTALSSGNALAFGQSPLAGDILLGGPGSLQVLAGRKLDLGGGSSNPDGTGVGISTVGNARNPFLPFEGAHIIAGAGIGGATSLRGSNLQFDSFIDEFVTGGEGATYLAELGINDFDGLSPEEQARVALEIFYLVLRDAGRDFNTPGSPGFGNYASGFAAIEALFGAGGTGDIITQSRNIRTKSGGNISLIAPGGSLTLSDIIDARGAVPPGIVTEAGGNVSIFTDGSVNIGVGRIFTLRGGDMVIWSSTGDIAAGSASKTVQSAPPTRVIIDPQSATVETDLAGLATGGGIGVLATVAGVEPGNVDLIAPGGIIDAGDAGIRVTGNINLAATQILNASNIAVGGASAGAPAAPAVSAPNIGGISSASNTAAATSSAATTSSAAAARQEAAPVEEETAPSIITVEVLGYGGGRVQEEEDEEEKKRREQAGGGEDESAPGAENL